MKRLIDQNGPLSERRRSHEQLPFILCRMNEDSDEPSAARLLTQPDKLQQFQASSLTGKLQLDGSRQRSRCPHRKLLNKPFPSE
ncbi:hypothetical protein Q5P01_020996 [Channa striata]|uniref:Uncharacterized protein n=1 Tax=Channa striata TaxID=64152 RepID=A0AA88LYF4_CHASR|nr:hypothetical protein Q5P01_020996 [Channa striata]